ncbi:hypothetical protein [Oceaniglobus roseus]|uniref:hypothetical protein n=1 Tax=Oceaniglobus roseus TaxID=1737570 RepID=UPI00130001FD|nr:hypothetical protein [Kandeliimicrobium roseum]
MAGAAGAQQATAAFSDIDTDASGSISFEEAAAVFGPRGAEGLFRNDIDGDGELGVAEVVEGGRAIDSDGNVVDADDNVIDEASIDYEDIDRGHGNDPDGFDDDNPGRGHDSANGERGGGHGNSGGNGNSGGKGRNG